MYPQGYQPVPARIDPIVRPGVPAWTRALAVTTPSELSVRAVGGVLVPIAFLLLMAVPGWFAVGAAGTLVSTIAQLVAVGAAFARLQGNVVSAPDYRLRGVTIEGAALDLLADIQNRFRWAEKMCGQVPTGIRWDEVANEVQVLLWDAAEHAATVSALDTEIRNLAYANPGTAQAGVRADLQHRRAAYWAMLEETQREADDLAREASNTAAAARLALRTGTLADLELLAPSGANLVARGTLAAARARLALLAEVWSELEG
jgi:hypothetical protein